MNRRAVIVEFNGTRITASMAGIPHAGTDSKAESGYAGWRSGGYGAGYKLDAVKGNNMHGVFDLHF